MLKHVVGITCTVMSAIALIALFGSMIGGTCLSYCVIEDHWGPAGGLVALVFLPLLFSVAPWYALVKGDALPLVVTYGGMIVVILMYYLRLLLLGDNDI